MRLKLIALYTVALWLFLPACDEDGVDAPLDVDVAPPSQVSNLAVGVEGATDIVLTWTAPHDEDEVSVSGYDVRYSAETINNGNWANATTVTGEPTPSDPGTVERFVVPGLAPNASRYFALRAADAAGNPSGLSNNALLDRDPPAAITDLGIVDRSTRSIRIIWTAPDDNATGRAAFLDIRYSEQVLNEQSWGHCRGPLKHRRRREREARSSSSRLANWHRTQSTTSEFVRATPKATSPTCRTSPTDPRWRAGGRRSPEVALTAP